MAAFDEGLRKLGWIDGNNIKIEVRWAAADLGRMTALAKELVSLQPDLIVGQATPVTAALQRETKSIPIVFVVVSDPVGSTCHFPDRRHIQSGHSTACLL